MTNAGNWKSRFTQEQLDRKRATDRAAHKKSRQRSKLATAELEQRLQLAVAGDRGTLINRLLADNARLQRSLDFYRSRLETILQAGQECLAEEDDVSSKEQDASNSASHQGDAAPVGGTILAQESSFEFVPSKDSILHEISSFSSMSPTDDDPAAEEPRHCPTNEVIDAVMTWKMFSGKAAAGLDFISERLCMASNPPCQSLNLKNLEQAVSSESAYEDILEHLLYDAPTPIQKISETTGDRASRTVALSEIERQRRAAAICACENSRRWRCHFRSKVEYITLFWAQYRYYLFLICPTSENYERCFPWHRPQPAQFVSRHPSFIDFLVWPRLRAHLTLNWHKYSAHDLIASLIQSFEVRCPTVEHGCWIKAKPDLSGLELDESFERIVRNIENLVTNDEFYRQYPDLFAMANSRADKVTASPLCRHLTSPRRQVPSVAKVTKPSRRTALAKAKRNLRSAAAIEDRADVDEELREALRRDNDRASSSTAYTDGSMGDLGDGQVASVYFDHTLFPLDTMFGSSELAALASMANLDFASFTNSQEAPETGT
ncbi:hypothetical protein NLU13_3568 [Sarocladium strictum]|uniref:BZIP domain-containing protein n=1 Tax=Sarocladium strictum TaxID=5046 RepID=A0AA39GMA0_SARSR|nr:hypothetical protein NLU13_3568 [Sarocladium strictum]